ncbi:CDP-glucose 4,6-dehydratase [Jeongeupia sp. USM3]|uniref:CDP-glucose 4,6-dehydratase n=1 Tax=Jeongeupia sp. USM3 TaxID=1906741 RepID=UPI00089DD76C|nr:CDP-glucose 4,6-dehydratase [Jeongeupia sp. USM3]AOX99296.1 CDP-glucose 4,6-dehydratase [Jeongeupia sp. USM3]
MDVNLAYRGKRVFITGHTGFKGGWLLTLLNTLGAEVHGFALAPDTSPNLFELADLQSMLASHTIGDICQPDLLRQAIDRVRPEIVFHLAAQPLVRASYRAPILTWQTNVLGTAHVLEGVRHCPSVRAVVAVTTDKCYDNREWHWGYRETDRLGGYDPYSASKAACELLVDSYRKSYLEERQTIIATARAGNVIGGGDWAEDRLIPDAVRAVQQRQPLVLRRPAATRPWQHVLAPLHGYLLLGACALRGDPQVNGAFNFGPNAQGNLAVGELLHRLQRYWPELQTLHQPDYDAPHEAALLHLDSSKAQQLLGWQSRWSLDESLQYTADWYRTVLDEPQQARALTLSQIERYFS